MEIIVPADCGNAPRMVIVRDVIAAWAAGDLATLEEALAAEGVWTLVGERTCTREDLAATVPTTAPDRLALQSIITHGRLAACDGVLVTGEAEVPFSHVLRFASAGRAARITEVRTYRVP